MKDTGKEQHTLEELRELQSLPLDEKEQVTKARIIEWYEHYDGQVYIAFSGGKDSTVLRYIAQSIYPDIMSVFSDTGLEFPEIRNFAMNQANVTVIRPEMNFKQVIETYGYPVISKRTSETIEYGKTPGSYRWKSLHGINQIKNGKPSKFNCQKWAFLLDAPFKVSARCCEIMKKRPLNKYAKESGKAPIVATMATESMSRQSTWMHQGCNAFDNKHPISQPMSFWTEQDVLLFLDRYHDDMLDAVHNDMRSLGVPQDKIDKVVHPWASVYGELVQDANGEYRFTKAHRTGCMFCGYGAHLEKSPNRFQRMKNEHPKQYDFCMRECEKGGLGMAAMLDYIGVEYK